ncbi:MAG: hypothetical protein IKN72_03700 [Clostridia bacterium]|nr:hypothetical protein [Clostridia bacterium]
MKKMKEAPAPVPTTYRKRTLLQSNRYRHQRVALEVLLEDDKTYTLAEVDALLTKFER